MPNDDRAARLAKIREKNIKRFWMSSVDEDVDWLLAEVDRLQSENAFVVALNKPLLESQTSLASQLAAAQEREARLRGALADTLVALGGCITTPACGGCAWCNATALLDAPANQASSEPRPTGGPQQQLGLVRRERDALRSRLDSAKAAVEQLGDEVLRMVFAFDPDDSRRADVRSLAHRIATVLDAPAKPEGT